MAGASGKMDVHRIAGNLATATLSGNLARGDMHLTTTPVNDPNGQDGQSTTLSSLRQQPTYEVLGWSFGNSDAAPWAMPDKAGFPILYWQKAKPVVSGALLKGRH